jgi:diphosphomevalonate decarboxylase
MTTELVNVLSPINIAFIKYWGKREGGEDLILPTNDSFSITLSTGKFRTHTSVLISDKIEEDELWLNGEKRPVETDKRLVSVLQNVRNTADPARAGLKVLMVSKNNFPTAAGMASSAAGLCALACALQKAFKATIDPSVLARLGSGSACRSVYGGFVKWFKGENPDGSDCLAKQFVDHAHWPEMNVLCAVVKAAEKAISSTKGMQLSVQTSPMMKDRIDKIVPARMADVSEAVQAKDFERFANITMADSDDLQAVCRTTVPTIVYATDDSFTLIKIARQYNAVKGKACLGYTFDAGANCFMFTLDETLVEVVALLLHYFPTADGELILEKKGLAEAVRAYALPEEFKAFELPGHAPHSLTFLLQSPVGQGVTETDDTLIDIGEALAKASGV